MSFFNRRRGRERAGGGAVLRGRARWMLLTAVVVAGCLVGVGAAASGSTTAKASSTPAVAPIGILSAVGMEQAPVLAAMHVTKSVYIDGYLFYVGTIDGHPVVDVFSGEVDESAELAAYILITHFHPRAMLFSGTAGAETAVINVGDVVVSGMVIDKSNLHYQLGGYQTAYEGVEMHVGPGVSTAGDSIAGYDNPLPTPSTAKNFGYGTFTVNRAWVYIDAFAATRQLVKTAEDAPSLGTISVANATGDTATGSISNKVVVGVIGQAPVWTEPLSFIESEDSVYQSDAEENEGTGFAFACASQGVPWMLVRGISDTPWHPNAFQGVVASVNAAKVTIYVVDHLPDTINPAPAIWSDLSPYTNARKAGYVIAVKAWYKVGPVTKIEYMVSKGKTRTLSGGALAALEKEYTYGASKIGPVG